MMCIVKRLQRVIKTVVFSYEWVNRHVMLLYVRQTKGIHSSILNLNLHTVYNDG